MHRIAGRNEKNTSEVDASKHLLEIITYISKTSLYEGMETKILEGLSREKDY